MEEIHTDVKLFVSTVLPVLLEMGAPKRETPVPPKPMSRDELKRADEVMREFRQKDF